MEKDQEARNEEYKQEKEKNLQMIAAVDKFEKCLIKEINEEQRKLAGIGMVPKLLKYSRLIFPQYL